MPFVGRDDDLGLLRATYERTLRESSVQLVTVTGEPGVGKTRLVGEFRDWVDAREEIVYWRQGRCLPYGEGITYWALGEMVKAHAGVLETDTPAEVEEKLDLIVGRTVAEADRGWVLRRLAPLFGLEVEPGERDEAFAAWQQFLEGAAEQRPLVLVFEDLHWADEALARVRRAPRRLVERSAAARRLHGPPGALRAPSRLGRRQAQLDHDRRCRR